MQTKDQGKAPKDWKVIAAVATASALGLSGLALADSESGTESPDPINLVDRTPITEVTVAKNTSTTLADLGVRVVSADSVSSPFDEPAPTTTLADSVASVDSVDSVASVASVASADSVASVASVASPEPAPSVVADSPDVASADSGASAASPDDSADSAGSVDNSADS
jgi:hypothetical protein